MPKIAIIEYQNYINEFGQPKGHGKKALDELYQILSMGDYDIKRISSKEYSDTDDHSYNLESIVRTTDKRLIRVYRLWKNFRKAIELSSDCDLIWFTNTDWMLLLWIACERKRKKTIITVFRDLFEDAKRKKWFFMGRVVEKLLEISVQKIDLAVVTNPKHDFGYYRKITHIPDFFYDENKYTRFKNCSKKDRIVCVGLMIRDKDIEGVIKHYKDSEVPISIIGDFEDSKYYESISDISTERIVVENKRLSDEEFIETIGLSKYVIMPYSKYMYSDATSGVLLETIFCGSIPIAPNFLLRNNRVNGIGYDDLEELPKTFLGLSEKAKNISNDISGYRKECIFKHIDEAVKNIVGEVVSG